jgi:aspartate/methionine/tyrosine aminotransferase
VTVHQGATQALNAVLQLCCDPGSGILLPEIYFPNYIQQTTLSGVRPRFYAVDDHYVPVLDDLEGLVDDGTRAILINTPSNPTGALFPEKVVRALYDFARRHNLWVISDEAYCEYVFEGRYTSPLQLDYEVPEAERRVIAIHSFSKSFACTGLRLGWSVAPREEVAGQLMLMNEPFTGSLTTPLQYGLAKAFDIDDMHSRIEALRPRWQLAGRALREAGLPFDPPEGGIFFFVDIASLGMGSVEFCDRALAEAQVAVVPGAGFGLQPSYSAEGRVSFAPGVHAARCFRLCFAVPEERLKLGVERLKGFISGLG